MKGYLALICMSLVPQLVLGADRYDPLANYRDAVGYTFDKQNKIVLGVGLASFAVARRYDDDLRSHYAHQRRLQGSEVFFNKFLGTGVPGALIGMGFWAVGEIYEESYAIRAGQAQLEALFATGVLTAAFKGLIGRERPDGGRHSFPSGHTSTVSASAMTLWEFYGWKAGVPAFTLAIFTGLSRVSTDRHWVSDIVGGVTLGAWVGHAVARAHLKKIEESESGESPLTFAPVFEEGGGRLIVFRRF